MSEKEQKADKKPPEDKPDKRDEREDEDFLADWKRLNENPPSVKDGPPPKKD
jgi:hypothetical protein